MRIVLKYRKEPPGKNYVGVDNQYSGGYPYPTDGWSAHPFRTEEDALRYQKHFAESIEPKIYYLSYTEVEKKV